MAVSIRIMQKQIVLLEPKMAHLQTDPAATCFSKKSHVSVFDSEEIVTSDVNVAVRPVNEVGDDEEDAEAEYTAHDSEMIKTCVVKPAVPHVNDLGDDDLEVEKEGCAEATTMDAEAVHEVRQHNGERCQDPRRLAQQLHDGKKKRNWFDRLQKR
eukprot:TRINITY_DN14443_c0_g2_i1.p1 TRINITY_DN14443_c0_g2~~TRINITY_DN14443_c0_g2_i1.p1  ORF type:complete len:177 (-),score=34.81 TRINITY_DN14443_c0_g2_i1:307-771(-)